MARGQRGFTLVELAVSLAVAAALVGLLASIVAGVIRVPGKIRSELVSAQQVQKASLLITEDASVAQEFIPGQDPEYGTFKRFEFSGASPVPVEVRYLWDTERVMRSVDRGGEVTPPQVVIRGVRQYADLAFTYLPPAWTYNPDNKTWSYTEGKVTVALTTTHEAGAEFPDTVFTANLAADLRPQIDRPVPLPGRLPPPEPLPNEVEFRIAGDPTLLQGTYRSGSGADLRYDDDSHYVVRGEGTPRILVWEAVSEPIDYSEITDITVAFTGQTDKAGVSQGIFVFNPSDPAHTDGGYDTSPDDASTYTAGGSDQTAVVTFGADDVAYVNSLATKVVKIKVRATADTIFDLRADKLVFKVAGTPSSTFFRDYTVASDPSLEVGSYVGGDFTSLGKDDISYYITEEISGTVQWTVVSEPIALDTISTIEVRFIGRVTRGAPVQDLFVFNPAHGGDGYGTTPDHESTYSATGTDTAASFFLSAEDIQYVGSLFPKEVRLRLSATDTSTARWRLEADQIIFRVKP